MVCTLTPPGSGESNGPCDRHVLFSTPAAHAVGVVRRRYLMSVMRCILLSACALLWTVSACCAHPIAFRNGQIVLYGDLSLPPNQTSPAPVLIIIPGGGAEDRDGNVTGAVDSAPWAHLARLLNQAGWAVLRYDKQGVGESAPGRKAPQNRAVGIATLSELALDAIAAVGFATIQRTIDAKQVYLFGRDEGAMIATDVAWQLGARIRGLIVADMPPCLPWIRQWQNLQIALQNRGVLGDALKAKQTEFLDALAAIRTGAPVPAVSEEILPAFPGVNPAYLRQLYFYDPPAHLAQVKQPTLMLLTGTSAAVHGAKDLADWQELVDGSKVTIQALNAGSLSGQLATAIHQWATKGAK